MSTSPGAIASAASISKRSTRSSRPARSSPAPGSSSNKSSGSAISDRAIRQRFRSPSERVPNVRFARWARFQLASNSSRRASSAGSYTSIHLPATACAPVITALATDSPGGRSMSSPLLAQPIRVRSSAMSVAPSSSPRTSMRPLVGNIRPARIESRVVLPAPLGPITTQRSPSETLQLTLSRRSRSPLRTVSPMPVNTSATGRAYAEGSSQSALVSVR